MARQAPDLAEALNNFAPGPIEFGKGGRESFYVEREDDPLEGVRTLLRSGQGPHKILIAGHRGCGKSTELNRLVADPEIRKRHAVVKFSVRDQLDLNDIEYIDLLVTAVALTYQHLATADVHLRLDERVVERLRSWQGEVVERFREAGWEGDLDVEAGVGVSTPRLVASFFAKITGRLKVEHTSRTIVREVVEPRLSSFLDSLNTFFAEVDRALAAEGRQLLLILEDLDKIPDIERALTLFRDKEIYLARPPCAVLYTVPIAIHYHQDFPSVARIFGRSRFVPNIHLYHFTAPERRYEAGWRTMESFVTRRMEPSLLGPGALKAAVRASGGVFQQLERLMEEACIKALSRQDGQSQGTRPKISKRDVLKAEADLRAEFERPLATADFPILIHARETHQAPSDPRVPPLLHNLYLIEYRNDKRWCDINPVLIPTLEYWQKIQNKANEEAPE